MIDTENKLTDEVTLKNVVMLILCIIKNDESHPQIIKKKKKCIIKECGVGKCWWEIVKC